MDLNAESMVVKIDAAITGRLIKYIGLPLLSAISNIGISACDAEVDCNAPIMHTNMP